MPYHQLSLYAVFDSPALADYAAGLEMADDPALTGAG
jgi:hypothetical protein